MSHDEIEGRSLMEKLSLILWRERELLETYTTGDDSSD